MTPPNTASLEYGPMRDGETDAVVRLITHAFAGTRDGSAEWLRSSGVEHQRIVRDRGGVVACLLRIPMGQFFGGRSVPLLGVAGVAVGPESRGKGYAAWMMRELLREARGEGFPIAGLYASTHSLYRKVGYEQSGHRFLARIPLLQIDVRERGGEIVALNDSHHEAVRACYTAFASRFNGMLDRGPYVWARVQKLRDEQMTGFGVRGAGGGLDGYIYLVQRRKDTGRHDIILSDLAFNTAAAGRRLLGLLADFSTMGEELVFPTGPHHPILGLLTQQRYAVALKDYWMTRIVDVKRALEARPWGRGLAAEVHLDVQDECLPENAGRWVMTVECGRAEVRPGGRGDVALDARSLAALYTGFIGARPLGLMGRLEGSPEAVETLAAVFDGPTPWMTDHY